MQIRRLYINHEPVLIACTSTFNQINLIGMQYRDGEFYSTQDQIIPEYSKSNIEYLNPTEEQIFQYNTVMDFSTMQTCVLVLHELQKPEYHLLYNNNELSIKQLNAVLEQFPNIKERDERYIK